MELFATKLRKRAEELRISNAEAARRAGLTERRYANYVTGAREPELATFIRIARALGSTPNDLLGFNIEVKRPRRANLQDRLMMAAAALDERALEIVVAQVEAVAAMD